MRGLAVKRQHGDGNALLVHAVKAHERRSQACQARLHVRERIVGVHVVKRGERDGLVAALRRAVHKHGRRVQLEVVVAAHKHLIAGVKGERAAAEFGRLHVCRQKRQRLAENGVDRVLVAAEATVDQTVEVVGVRDIHGIQVVRALGVRDLANRRKRVGARAVQPDAGADRRSRRACRNRAEHFAKFHSSPFQRTRRARLLMTRLSHTSPPRQRQHQATALMGRIAARTRRQPHCQCNEVNTSRRTYHRDSPSPFAFRLPKARSITCQDSKPLATSGRRCAIIAARRRACQRALK